MASSGRSTAAGPNPTFLPPVVPLIHDAIQRVLTDFTQGGVSCADAVAALCHDRAADVAAMPVPVAATLVRSAVEAATRTLGAGNAEKQADVLATLRHLLACPPLRDVAVKASRLKSLAIAAMQVAPRGCDLTRADAAVAAVLQVLQEAGVDVAMAGSLKEGTTPLIMALRWSSLGAAQVLLDAGADVNGLSRDGMWWPLLAAAMECSDEGMAWLLERGASLTISDSDGRTIAHSLASAYAAGSAATAAAAAEFCCRWMRRVVVAEPSLLEARGKNGETPLLAAARAGSTACVSVLLELGAEVAATNVFSATALSFACVANSLPVVRQLIAAGAASAAALPPGSRQSILLAKAAITAAVLSERGCGECAARCGGDKPSNCADGLDILRAVLAAGVREAVGPDGQSLGSRVVSSVANADAPDTISGGHALAVLQALHAAGVDVLARGPADELPVLHAVAEANAPALVRWLVAEAGAPLEERDSKGYTPLLTACDAMAWAAAHALLDCGARVDVQSSDELGAWPVLLAVGTRESDCALLRRLLAADRDSLLRCTPNGATALHIAVVRSRTALPLLLGSGLSHLAEAINAAAVVPPLPSGPVEVTTSPLHVACSHSNWDAALALLAAGARVDIAGDINGRFQTIAAWARSSPACKHRGVKLAVAARAREHAAEAARSARGAVDASGSSGGPSVPSQPTAHATRSSSGAASYSAAVPEAAGAGAAASRAGNAPSPAAALAGGAGQRATARKRGKAGAGNRAEEWVDDDARTAAAAAAAALPVIAAARPASWPSPVTDGVQALETGAVASSAHPNACVAASAADAASRDLPDATASALPAANLPEEPPAGRVPALSAANLPEEAPVECAPAAADAHSPAGGTVAPSVEPGTAASC